MIYELSHSEKNGDAAREQKILIADLQQIHSEFKFDIRYARTDNFMKKSVYPEARAFLLKHVADDLVKVHQSLKPHGFGLLIFDGYRPWAVTKLFWDASNEHDRQFLANPEAGSSHNRGCAVDLSLYWLKTGEPVEMPSDFDEMNEKAYPDYGKGSAESRHHRDLLKTAMLANGFTGIRYEWWHFNHLSHQQWPVLDLSFAEILRAPQIPSLLQKG
jgi:D-alanyl-D-alanine dipeptidase